MAPPASSSKDFHLSTPGNVIRVALAFESVVTVAAGSYFMFFPRHFLLHAMGASAAQVTTTAMQYAQQIGAVNVFVGATIPLFIPNTKEAIESRRGLYSVILAFEFFYMSLLGWQAFMMDGGLPRNSLLAGAGQLVPFMAWRIFTLGWKPKWFGRYQEGEKAE